jgi:hypothetical protein
LGEVVYPPFVTCLDIPAERVVEAAKEADLESVVVLGYDRDGDEYFASSFAGSPEVIYLMERLKKKLLEMPEEL